MKTSRDIGLQEFCAKCGKLVDLYDDEKATKLLKISFYELFRLLDMGDLHKVKNDKGVLTVCSKSIFTVFHMGQTRALPEINTTDDLKI